MPNTSAPASPHTTVLPKASHRPSDRERALREHETGQVQGTTRRRPQDGTGRELSPALLKLIGAAEVAGALGLVLPGAPTITTRLVPTAAFGLAIIMLGAIVTHARRGELPSIAVNLVLLALAVFVAVERIGPHRSEPLQEVAYPGDAGDVERPQAEPDSVTDRLSSTLPDTQERRADRALRCSGVDQSVRCR